MFNGTGPYCLAITMPCALDQPRGFDIGLMGFLASQSSLRYFTFSCEFELSDYQVLWSVQQIGRSHSYTSLGPLGLIHSCAVITYRLILWSTIPVLFRLLSGLISWALFTKFSVRCQATGIDIIGRIAYRSTGGTRGSSTHGCDPGASVPMLLELLFAARTRRCDYHKRLWNHKMILVMSVFINFCC